jgi:hypothetical protein
MRDCSVYLEKFMKGRRGPVFEGIVACSETNERNRWPENNSRCFRQSLMPLKSFPKPLGSTACKTLALNNRASLFPVFLNHMSPERSVTHVPERTCLSLRPKPLTFSRLHWLTHSCFRLGAQGGLAFYVHQKICAPKAAPIATTAPLTV